MILEFKVKNFRSICDVQIFSMVSEPKVKELPENTFAFDEKTNVLRTSIIYGRNGSGKSNLLLAIQALVYMVYKSADFKLKESISTYQPFKLKSSNLDAPVEFSIDFVSSKKIRYVYSVSFNKDRILAESLFFYPGSQQAKLFIREKNKIKYGEYLTGRKKQVEDLLLENQLFLSMAGKANLEALHDAYNYLSKKIELSTFHDNSYDEELIKLYTQKMESGTIPNFRENLNKLVRAADTGITSISARVLDIKESKLPNDFSDAQKKEIVDKFRYQIKTKHTIDENGDGLKEVEFDLLEESAGTIKLLAIGGLVLDTLYEGGTLIIDELDKSLHPKLTELIIKLFHDTKTNPHNAQLIFATHDATLLDNSLFRRDQIWIAEKEYPGNSVYFSLSDIKGIRKDIPYDKWYLSGRFRGIPLINELELDLEIA